MRTRPARPATPPSDAVGRPVAQPLLVARDPHTVEAALAAAAAAGVVLDVQRDPSRVRAAWRSAPVVVVGVEMAALVCGMALEARSGVHLAGPALDELASWSAPLQASVLVLPDQSALLTQVLEQGRADTAGALVVRLVGGSGGLGTSTLACALAQQAASRGQRAAVVELDPAGGGLDVLFGAEAEPGWRWPDLRAAAGHVDTLAGRLVNVCGVDVVAHGRGSGQGPAEQPSPAAARAVVASLCRSHDLVVLDAGGGQAPLLDAWPGERLLLVCGADVRSVVAARSRAWHLGLHDAELVVRTGAGRRLAPDLVGEGLGIPVAGTIGDDRRVVRAAEDAAPVGRGRRGLAGQAGRLLDVLVDGTGR